MRSTKWRLNRELEMLFRVSQVVDNAQVELCRKWIYESEYVLPQMLQMRQN